MGEAEDRVSCFRAAVLLERTRAGAEELLREIDKQRIRSGAANGTTERRSRTLLQQTGALMARAAAEVAEYCRVDGEILTGAEELDRAVRSRQEFDLALAFKGVDRLHRALDRPTPVSGPAPGDPPLIVLTNEGYVTVRGPKHDISLFLRLTDGDIQFELYPPGRAPPSGTDEDVGEQHQRAQETIGIDGGDLLARNRLEIEAAEREVFEMTGARVRLATAPPPFGSIEGALGITSVKHEKPPPEDLR